VPDKLSTGNEILRAMRPDVVDPKDKINRRDAEFFAEVAKEDLCFALLRVFSLRPLRLRSGLRKAGFRRLHLSAIHLLV
jgi:hypothetical protein